MSYRHCTRKYSIKKQQRQKNQNKYQVKFHKNKIIK